jgi:hypothetical protein
MIKQSQQTSSEPIEVPAKLIIDREEYEAAIRTARAHILARNLGIKLPYSIAKKMYCRCGKIFVYPDKFLKHRLSCAVLIRDQDILDRKPKEVIVAEIKEKKKHKELFECRCGHPFPSKRMRAKHEKICHSYQEWLTDIYDRGKEYLDRTTEKGKKRANTKKASKRKGSKRVRISRRLSKRS